MLCKLINSDFSFHACASINIGCPLFGQHTEVKEGFKLLLKQNESISKYTGLNLITVLFSPSSYYCQLSIETTKKSLLMAVYDTLKRQKDKSFRVINIIAELFINIFICLQVNFIETNAMTVSVLSICFAFCSSVISILIVYVLISSVCLRVF